MEHLTSFKITLEIHTTKQTVKEYFTCVEELSKWLEENGYEQYLYKSED